jgi:hypothetical protein
MSAMARVCFDQLFEGAQICRFSHLIHRLHPKSIIQKKRLHSAATLHFCARSARHTSGRLK